MLRTPGRRAVACTLWHDLRLGGADRTMRQGGTTPNAERATGVSAAALDVFALCDGVVDEYRRFATSFTTIQAPDIREQVEAIYAGNRYWPEPLIQINPSYRRSTDVGTLVANGVLDSGCADIFRAGGEPLSLYKHQEQAVALAAGGESFVVTTGTGSGKSLCFFVPIVSHVLDARRTDAERRTRAIVVYPMNALANSQMEELAKFIDQVPGDRPITFDRYTGQDDRRERSRIANEPPDILLTNFMMLELLMTRQDDLDRRVIGNCEDLGFLVLDELHTYRGRQGADVALLVRRVRERLQPAKLLCIGTSATMASEGSLEDKNRVVADVASKLFGCRIAESNVIAETLERITESDRDRGFGKALSWRGRRFRGTVAHLRRGAPGAPARGVGGDAPWHLVLRGRSALGPGQAHDGDRGGGRAVAGVRPARRRLPQGVASPPSGVERPRAGTDHEPRRE